MAWSDDAEELKHIKNDVGSQLASMECVPRHNTIDCPTLYWAAMPGNAADFPAEESFHTFIEQAVCLFTEETNYRSSLSPFGIKMVDKMCIRDSHINKVLHYDCFPALRTVPPVRHGLLLSGCRH